jgi:hypothetical protein
VGCFDSTDINECSRDGTLAPRALQLVPQTSSVTAHFNTGARLKIWQSAKRILTECYSEVNQRRIMYHLLSNKMHVTITHIVTVLMPRYVSVLQHHIQGILKLKCHLVHKIQDMYRKYKRNIEARLRIICREKAMNITYLPSLSTLQHACAIL